MRFEFYHPKIDRARTMMVDGVEESRLNMSHWPGNRTPEHLKADTSTEICLKLAADPYADRLFENVEIVSNNHFDTDGLLSCWAALHPQDALRHCDFLIAAAQAGDFGWHTTPEAVKFDLVVSAFEDPERSPLRAQFSGLDQVQKYQLIYDALLESLPALLKDFESSYGALWEEEFAVLEEAREALKNGAGEWRRHPAEGLSVFRTGKEFPLTSRFNQSEADRLLTFVQGQDGVHCEFCYDIVTWFETTSLVKKPRLDLTRLVERLNEAEKRGDAQWCCDALEALYPGVSLCDTDGNPVPTRLPMDWIEDEFVGFFREAGARGR